MFKIGDRVRRNNIEITNSSIEEGALGTVVSLNDECLKVILDKPNRNDNSVVNLYKYKFDLVVSKKTNINNF